MVLPRTTRSESMVYGHVLACLAQKFSVIYAAEPDPSQVIKKLSKLEVVTNDEHHSPQTRIFDYLRNGLLTIVASNGVRPSRKRSQSFFESRFMQLLIAKARENSGSRGLLVIASPTNVLQNHGSLVEFENAMNKNMKDNLHICWYDDDAAFNRTSFEQMIFLLRSHDTSIHTSWSYREWHLSDIQDIVRRSIDEVLGEGTSYLAFKTIRLIYNLREEALYSNPELLHRRLRRIFGTKATDLIIANASDAIRKQLGFSSARMAPKVRSNTSLKSVDSTSC